MWAESAHRFTDLFLIDIRIKETLGQADSRIMIQLGANALCHPWKADEETTSEGKQTEKSCWYTATLCHKLRFLSPAVE